MQEAFLAGEVPRGAAPRLTGYQERQGRLILATLIEKDLLVSQGPRAPVRLGFPYDGRTVEHDKARNTGHFAQQIRSHSHFETDTFN